MSLNHDYYRNKKQNKLLNEIKIQRRWTEWFRLLVRFVTLASRLNNKQIRLNTIQNYNKKMVTQNY